MTTSTPLTTQGIYGQQGSFGQGLSPFGIEQTLGVPQQPIFGQSTYPFTQQWYGGSFGQQMPFGGGQQHLQQVAAQATIQILPYLQQTIMPQVAAQAVALVGQQLQQQVPQVVAQLMLPYLTGQHGQPAWQQTGYRPF